MSLREGGREARRQGIPECGAGSGSFKCWKMRFPDPICSVKVPRPQRCLAAFLLFLVIQDIGFHIAESFFAPSEGTAAVSIFSGPGFADPDGCGIPEHSGAPFHHHHFPAVVTQAPLPIPLVAVARLAELLP